MNYQQEIVGDYFFGVACNCQVNAIMVHDDDQMIL